MPVATEKKTYETRNQALVCTLRIHGLDTLEVKRVDDEVCWVFESTGDLIALSSIFFRREALVEPVAFFRQHTRLRDEVKGLLRRY